jgi:hypothetical protein
MGRDEFRYGMLLLCQSFLCLDHVRMCVAKLHNDEPGAEEAGADEGAEYREDDSIRRREHGAKNEERVVFRWST